MSLPFLVPESKQPSAEESFLLFWSRYPRKIGKFMARKAWNRMTAEERAYAVEAVLGWAEYWKMLKTEHQFIPYASTWLNRRSWEDVEK